MTPLRNNKFIISCPARSGSTMLLHLLRSNRAVLCHGEVFGGERLGHLAGSYAVRRKGDAAFDDRLHALFEADPKRFLYDIVFDGQGRSVSGFKFKTDEAFGEQCRDIQEMISADSDIKVVQLRRRNLLDQYISHQVVLKQTGVTLVMSGQERPSVEPFLVDVRDAVLYFIDVLEREAKVATAYAHHRRLTVDYEDLAQDGHPVREALQKFLGVPVQPLTTTTRKIIERNAGLVRNLDEVHHVLAVMGFGDRAGLAGASAATTAVVGADAEAPGADVAAG